MSAYDEIDWKKLLTWVILLTAAGLGALALIYAYAEAGVALCL